MSAQEALFELPEDGAAVSLTERQAFALSMLRRHGLDPAELGARLHDRRGSHRVYERCQWCEADGRGVLKSLRKKGLVKRKKDGTWLAVNGEVGYDPATAEIPF